MKLLTKTLCALLTTAASISALSTNAIAGEGGAAGSAAFSINPDGSVSGVAVSAAIGKQDAFAGAFNDAGSNNAAFAQGSAGTINISSLGSTSITNLTTSEDPQLGVDQGNSFDATTSVKIGTLNDSTVVNVAP